MILALTVAVLLYTGLLTAVSSQTQSNTPVSAPAIEWQKKFGEGESASQVIQTNDGGYAFLDLVWNHQETTMPAVLYKIDASGELQWRKTIKSFHANDLVQTNDRGYALLGEWNWDPNDYSPNVPTLIKTDSEGNIKWYENYTQAGDTISFLQSNDGGFALLFRNFVFLQDQYERWTSILKTDYHGKIQWNSTYIDLGNYTYVNSLIQTNDGGYAIVGSTSL